MTQCGRNYTQSSVEFFIFLAGPMLDDNHRYPLMDRFYQQFLIDENSASFIQSITRHYTLGTIERLAVYGKRVTRRGAALAIGFLGDFRFNETMGRALHDRDRAVRMLADHGIRQLWMRDGTPEQQSSLRRVVQLNDRHRLAEAIDLADQLIEFNPNFAEAWNQRAIARYGIGEYAEAIEDCQETLFLNRFHFSAVLGVANCYLQLDEATFALEFFRSALEINPDLENVRGQISHLERSLEG